MHLQHFSVQENPQDVSDFCFLWCAFTSHLDASGAPAGAHRSRGIKGEVDLHISLLHISAKRLWPPGWCAWQS